MSRSKYWCWTLNNYTPDDLDRLSAPNPDVVYMIFGREVGASGTPHLQGTTCFRERKRLTQVKAFIGQRAHCEATRCLTQSIEYCRKDGEVTEYGAVPQSKKDRSDLEAFKQSVKEGVTAIKELRELHSDVCAKFPRFVKEYLDDKRVVARVQVHELRPWQEELNRVLNLRPNSREIRFIVDREGNNGKSWFARHYCELHPNAQIIIPGKKADMAYAMREDCRVFFFDCPRSKQGEYVQYDFLEEVKNGYVFSPKYESRLKIIDTPHVVVFMNEQPDMTKLSADRYEITELTNG